MGMINACPKEMTHHRVLLRAILAHVEFLEGALEALEAEVERALAPLAPELALLETIPGVGRPVAATLLAELGADLRAFPSAKHLASWAGVCPGNRQSGGRRLSGKTTRGNVWRRGRLGEIAWAGIRTRGTSSGAHFRRVARRYGKAKAVVAIMHNLLTVIYAVLRDRMPCQELGPDYFARQDPQCAARRHVAQLECLGLSQEEEHQYHSRGRTAMPYADHDAVRVHYEVLGNAAGPPLLHHGFTGDRRDWHEFGYVDALGPDYRLLLPDARGHGASDKPHDPAAYEMSLRAGDVLAVLDAAGVQRAHYLGFSMGGRIGCDTARRAPERLKCYVDEVCFVRGTEKRYLYRAADETGQVVDVLFREHRDTESAVAFFRQARRRTTRRPTQVISDRHQPYIGTVQQVLPAAEHIRTGLHRARGETTKPIERSRVFSRDRLCAARGVETLATGQRVFEGFEARHALRRGHVCLAPAVKVSGDGVWGHRPEEAVDERREPRGRPAAVVGDDQDAGGAAVPWRRCHRLRRRAAPLTGPPSWAASRRTSSAAPSASRRGGAG